jgi:N6-adenosine-specific RNA methylase IME4
MSTFPGMPHLGTYRIVLADPPWSHENYGQAKHGAAKAIYDEMPLEALAEMPVGDLAHPDGALLFLWCTGPQAAEGAHLALARAWGFELRARAFVWVKTTGDGSIFFGPGSYTGGNVEDVWLGVRGDAPWSALRARRDVRQVVMAPRGRHSEKPEEVQDRIEALWPNATPRLELFARRRRAGWAAWGNQAPGCDLVFGDAIGTTWPLPARAPAPAAPEVEQAALFDGAAP